MILPPRSLSPTSIEAFARCPALYDYRHNHRLISAGYASALTVGKALHAAGEVLRKGEMFVETPLAPSLATAAAAFRPQPGADGVAAARDSLKVAIMIDAYWRRWYAFHGPPDHLVANELELRTPLINPATGGRSRTFHLHGYADAIV